MKAKHAIYDTKDVVLMEEHAEDEDIKLVLIQNPIFLRKLVLHTVQILPILMCTSEPERKNSTIIKPL